MYFHGTMVLEKDQKEKRYHSSDLRSSRHLLLRVWLNTMRNAYHVCCSIFRGRSGVMKKDNSLTNYSWLGGSSLVPIIKVLKHIKDYTLRSVFPDVVISA